MLEKEIKEKLLKAIELSLKINNETSSEIDFNYFGNNEGFHISIFYNGWKNGIKPDYIQYIFLDLETGKEKLNEIIEKLKELKGE